MESAVTARPGEVSSAEFRITEFPLHYVVFIQKYAQSAFSRALKPHGLTNQSWRVLAALSGGDALTVRQISELTAFDAANLCRALEAMARDGLVERQADPGDRRASKTEITESGRARFDAAHGDILGIYEKILDGFGAEEMRALMSGLRRLKRNCLRISGAPA